MQQEKSVCVLMPNKLTVGLYCKVKKITGRKHATKLKTHLNNYLILSTTHVCLCNNTPTSKQNVSITGWTGFV